MKSLNKKGLKNLTFALLSVSFLLINSTFSQCTFNNTNVSTVTLPGYPGSASVTCLHAGERVGVNVTAGNIYTFSTCGSTTFDSELTLYNTTGVTMLGYNDDFCGTQSQITWTATYTGVVHVLLDAVSLVFHCNSNSTCMDLNITCTVPSASGTGCNTDNTICTQGTAGPFVFGTPGANPVNCQNWLSSSQFSYIVLYITQTGPLNILISGNATTGFLDVSIYNIPAGQTPCNALVSANLLGCNYADFSGGCNEFGTSFGCSSTVPSPNVVAGQVVMIIVEDYTNGPSTSYTLQLAASPAAQTGPPNPAITLVGPYCENDVPVQLAAVNMGGTWTGPGISTSGLFDPSIAGPGTHTINYSIGQVPCSANSSTTIVVKPVPSVTVNSDINCGGIPTVLTATSSFPGGVYSWIPTASAQSITVSPMTTTSYTVTYSLNGCSSTPATGTITISGAPTFTVLGTNPTTCSSNDGIISFSNLIASTSYSISYSDDGIVQPSTVMTSNSAGVITIPNLNSGVYTNFTVSINGCTGSDLSIINFSNVGAPVLNNPGNQSVCNNYTLTTPLGSNLSGNEAYYTNSQAFGGTIISGIITTSQMVWMYDINGGCSSEQNFNVTITSTPIVSVTNASTCSGQSATITASSQTAGGTYFWTTSATTPSIIESPLLTTSYSVIYTVNGCPSISTTGTITVGSFSTANPAPDVQFCSGEISSIGSNPSIGFTYSWSPSVGLSSASVANPTISLTNSTQVPINLTYSLTITSSTGCVSTDAVLVTVNSIPATNFTSDKLTGCYPLTILFTNLTSPIGSSTTWHFGDGETSNSTSGTISHTFLTENCFDISLTSTSSNCTSSKSIPQMICTLPKANAQIMVDHPIASVLNPAFKFENLSTNSNSYTWFLGDGYTTTETNPSHIYENIAGDFVVTLIASTNGECSDTAYVNIQIIDELIYYVPNTFTPDNDNYNQTFQPVFTSGFDPSSFTLMILNRWGEIVFESHDSSRGWDGFYNHKMAQEGVYIWTVNFSDGVSDKRYIDSGSISLLR